MVTMAKEDRRNRIFMSSGRACQDFLDYTVQKTEKLDVLRHSNHPRASQD